MIKNSPLFIQKIIVLTLFSLLFSFLISIFDMIYLEKSLKQESVFIILMADIFVGLIFFSLIYFLSKRSNIARIILIVLIFLGILAYLFILLFENYSIFQGLLYLFSIFLDVYTLILLLSSDSNSFIKSGYMKNEADGSFKAWFSTLSSILLIMIIGAKFLNQYEFKKQPHIENKMQSEDMSIENQIESLSAKIDDVKAHGSEWENSPDFRDEGIKEESYDDTVNTISQMGEGQPIAVRFSINDFNTSLYEKAAYNIVVQGLTNGEITIYDVILNRGNKCGLAKYARETQIPATLKFGEYVELSMGNCDAQMIQEIEVKTNIGSYMFKPKN